MREQRPAGEKYRSENRGVFGGMEESGKVFRSESRGFALNFRSCVKVLADLKITGNSERLQKHSIL